MGSPEEYLLLATVVLVFKHLCFSSIMLKPSIYLSILMTMTSVVLAANEVKYAPNYCLRFRFNCQSESKRDHVCCLYPLPNGNEAPSRPNNNAMMKFRPIRLPNRKNTEENVSTERPQPINKNPNRPLPNDRRTTSTSAPVIGTSRPRICQRLIVNCASKPEHRCCQYEVEVAETPEVTSRPETEVITTTASSRIVK